MRFTAFLMYIFICAFVIARLYQVSSQNTRYRRLRADKLKCANGLESANELLTRLNNKSRANYIKARSQSSENYANFEHRLSVSVQGPDFLAQAANYIKSDADRIRQLTDYITELTAAVQRIAANTELVALQPVQFETLLALQDEQLAFVVDTYALTKAGTQMVIEEYQAAVAHPALPTPRLIEEHLAAVAAFDAATATLHATIVSVKRSSIDNVRHSKARHARRRTMQR